MSFRQRWLYSYHNIFETVASLAMPNWMFSARTKVVLCVLMVLTALAYIVQINTMSTSGYVIHTLEKQVSAIQLETRQLETKVAEHQSMVSIQKRLPELAMVKSPKVTFIEHTATPVAQR